MGFGDELTAVRDARHSRNHPFFEEHIEADALHGSKGLALVEKYCDAPELRQQAVDAVRDATVRRWRYMNGIYWFALHGKEDDTLAAP